MSLNLRTGALFVCLILMSCHKDKSDPSPTPTTPVHYEPLSLPSNGTTVIDASNDFAIRMFRATLDLDADNNTNKLISPLSIYTALSMVYNGSAGSTRDSMTRTMALNGIDISVLNAVNKALIEGLSKEDNTVKMSVANSIWYNNNKPKPARPFLDSVDKNYHGTIQGLDFNNPASVKTINSWVARQTDNKIPEIVDTLTSDQLLFLVNAVYFNGAWKYVFKASDTHNNVFYPSRGSGTSVPYMNQKADLQTYYDGSFLMVELPYGGGDAFCMDLFRPTNPAQSIRDFALSLDRAALTRAVAGLDTHSINIYLPKWESRYNIDNMKPHLGMLGMGIAFGDAANFTNMYPGGGAYITEAIHKTYIRVSEEGTEAAAVTAIGVSLTSSIPQPNIIAFDHPFLYLIREKQTGAILFIGIVNDPSKS